MADKHTTLADIIAAQRSRPSTVEAELALQDFLELPLNEQMETLFRGLVIVSARTDWCVAKLAQGG